MQKRKSISTVLAVFAGALLIAGLTMLPGVLRAVIDQNPNPEPDPHGLSGTGATLGYVVSPVPADTSLAITVAGQLSGSMSACGNTGGPDTIYINVLTGGAYSVLGGAVDILDGPLAGRKVPVSIISPERDGDCNHPGSVAQYSGTQTFDVSSVANGTYAMSLRVRDEENGLKVVQASFTVNHAAPAQTMISCTSSAGSSSVPAGSPVLWFSHASAGSDPGQQFVPSDYHWTFSDGRSASGDAVTQSYTTPGTIQAKVDATHGSTHLSKTCSVVIAPAPILPACSPANSAPPAEQNLSFSVAGGVAPFNWQADQGSPSAGPGNPFQTRFDVAGAREVKVTDVNGNFSKCFVNVGGMDKGKIVITSSRPTTWKVFQDGNVSPYLYQTLSSTGSDYPNIPIGSSYTLVPAVLTDGSRQIHPVIKASPSAPAQSDQLTQTLAASGAELDYYVDYPATTPPATSTPPCTGPTCNPPAATPGLSIAPAFQEIQAGSHAYFTAQYDPDGAGPQATQNVTLLAAWSPSDPAIAAFNGMSSAGSADFQGIAAGTTNINATYQGNTASPAALKVDFTPPPSLSALLSANPYDGDAPLASTLTAAATAQPYVDGTYNYTFWQNCDYVGTSVQVASQPQHCGAPLAKYDGVSADLKTTPALYPAAGFFHPMVIVERGGYATQAVAALVAHAPAVPPAATHSECVAGSCVRVNGSGPNRCGTDSDCGTSPNPPQPPQPFRAVCDPVQKACVNKVGAGAPTCSSDPACGTASGQSHLECQNQSCVIVGGPGSSTCATVGSQCNLTPPPPGAPGSCTFTASPSLISKGGSSTLAWSCGAGLHACTVTDDSTGAIVKSNGPAGSVAVAPKATTTYNLNCDTGAFTTSTTVKVISIIEVPPR